MLTGSKPFSGHETHEMRFLHQHARRPRPSSRAMIPDVFDTIVSKAMAIDPEARYQTPQALVEAFEQALRASGEAPEESGREGAPLFLLAELSTIDDSLSAPSEELWDDLETVRATFHELTKPPYVVHAVTDTSILVERRGAPGTAERMIDDCRSLAERLRTRPTPHPAVRVRLVVDERPPANEARPDPDQSVVVVVPQRK
jgi:serine/threonine protein kinase